MWADAAHWKRVDVHKLRMLFIFNMTIKNIMKSRTTKSETKRKNKGETFKQKNRSTTPKVVIKKETTDTQKKTNKNKTTRHKKVIATTTTI